MEDRAKDNLGNQIFRGRKREAAIEPESRICDKITTMYFKLQYIYQFNLRKSLCKICRIYFHFHEYNHH